MKLTIEIPTGFMDLVKRSAAYEGLSVEASIERMAVDAAIALMSDTEHWPLDQEHVARIRQDLFELTLYTPTGVN